MKLCINYLTEIALLNKEVMDKVDYIKYPSVSSTELEEMKDIKSKYGDVINYHGTLDNVKGKIQSISDDDFIESISIEDTKKALELSATKGFSIHMNSLKRGEKLDESLKDKKLDVISKNVKFLKDNFDLNYLILENIEGITFLDNPDYINKVVNDNNVGFLFDINHAYYSAKELGIEVYDYINRLPLDKLYEIHICGWYMDKDNIQRGHTPINEEAYEILEYVLKKCKSIKVITIEFGAITINGSNLWLTNDDEDIIEVKYELECQINRIKSIIDRYKGE